MSSLLLSRCLCIKLTQSDQFWRNFATFGKFLTIFEENFAMGLAKFMANVCTYFGNFYARQIFYDVILSHC